MDSEQDRAGKLTDGERRVLRIFLEQSDPKKIGPLVGLSVNTVRDYLKAARRTLGVGRSIDAAHLLARVEGRYPQSVGHPVGEVDGGPIYPPSVVASEEAGLISYLPFPTKGRPWNGLPVWVRLAWIAAGLVGLLIAASLAVSIGEAVSRIVRLTL